MSLRGFLLSQGKTGCYGVVSRAPKLESPGQLVQLKPLDLALSLNWSTCNYKPGRLYNDPVHFRCCKKWTGDEALVVGMS